jgi:hypothetical protein
MAGTWKALSQPPPFAASTMLLLTDGTVMCQEAGGVGWWRLAPDAYGSYLEGSWSRLAPMRYSRLYYASAVLADGRVLVAGGEYSSAGSETTAAEIYHPLLDVWSDVGAPEGWTRVGDAPCCVLPSGLLLLGSIDDPRTAIFNPIEASWKAAADKDDASSEESWALLGDGSVVTAECTNHPRAERYVPEFDRWVSAGAMPVGVDLVEAESIEIGPALLLPDGRLLAIGATPQTALYELPATPGDTGTWSRGPDIPPDEALGDLGAKDAPACLLPNGKVLVAVGPVDGRKDDYLAPTFFFEHDGAAIERIDPPGNSKGQPYIGRLMLLPTGEALFAAQTPEIYLYQPGGSPDPRWAPAITGCPEAVTALGTYQLCGTQLNGLSQAVAYGDDVSSATNYPLVRLRSKASNKVWYCRTFGHSTMGVATGDAVHSTWFTVPAGVDAGNAELFVVANGIASQPRAIEVV